MSAILSCQHDHAVSLSGSQVVVIGGLWAHNNKYKVLYYKVLCTQHNAVYMHAFNGPSWPGDSNTASVHHARLQQPAKISETLLVCVAP